MVHNLRLVLCLQLCSLNGSILVRIKFHGVQLVLVLTFILPSTNRHHFILRRLRRQSKLFVELLAQLLQLGKSFTEIVVFKVTSRFWILELPVWVFINVNALEIGKVNVIDVGVVLNINTAAFHLHRLW